MLFSVLLFFAGLLLLYYGAEYLVTGSSRLALAFGIRPLIVGMTVVAFATSMPELLVSLFAAVRGSEDIAAGNIIGSNIANIGLILGSAALLTPLAVPAGVVRREIPIMIAASVLLVFLVADGGLGFSDGLILLLLLLAFLAYCLRSGRDIGAEVEGELPSGASVNRGRDLALVLIGIVGLGVGAELMVRAAVTIARALGVSELIIGLSVVALGTSLPELAASVMSALRGHVDIGIGNVIGSNIFNILFVLGICPMIRPLAVDPSVMTFQLPVMLLFSVALLLLAWHKGSLGRLKGGGLLAGYGIFIAMLFL